MAATIRLSQQHSCSFDYLVGAGEQGGRHLEAERLGGRDIDDKIKAGRLQDGKVGRLFALQNAAGINSNLTTRVGKTSSIAHQPTSFDIVTHRINSGNCMARRQCRKLNTSTIEE